MVEGHRVQGHAGEHCDEVTNVHHDAAQQEGRVAREENPRGQHDGECDIHLGEQSNTAVDARQGRGRRHGNGNQDQPDLGRLTLFDAEENVDAHVQHHDANTERRCDTEDGCHDRRNVHGITGGALQTLAEKGIQRGSNGQRQALAVGEVAHRDAHEYIHAPAVEAVVEQGPHRRLFGGEQGFGVRLGRCHVLRDGFGNGEEHHIGPDARGEQHGSPRERGELRAIVVGAQPHLREPQSENDDEHQRRGCQQNVEPAEPVRRDSDDEAEDFHRMLRGDEAPERDANDQDERNNDHCPLRARLPIGKIGSHLVGRGQRSGVCGLHQCADSLSMASSALGIESAAFQLSLRGSPFG